MLHLRTPRFHETPTAVFSVQKTFQLINHYAKIRLQILEQNPKTPCQQRSEVIIMRKVNNNK